MRSLPLLCSLLLAGCASAPDHGVRVDPALATLIPADTILLAGIRMEELRATPPYRRWVEARPLSGLDEFSQRTGLDPRKDIWDLLVASNGNQTAVLARGKFSQQGLEPNLERPGSYRTPYKGYTLIGNERGAVVFVNSSTAVAGPPAAVRAIIDQRGRSQGVPAALQPRVRAVPAGNQLWLAAAGGLDKIAGTVPQSGNLANLGRILSMLDGITAAADLRSGLEAFADGAARTDQDAKSLADGVAGLIGLARLTAPANDPEMLRAFDGIKVAQQQRAVRIDARLDQGALDKLLARFGR